MMNYLWPSIAVCLGSACLTLPLQAQPSIVPGGFSEPAGETYSELDSTRLYQIARSISVKVYAGSTNGSGMIIQRQGSIYTIVTNHHVLTPGAPYQIETADGQVYQGEVLEEVTFGGNDLALMQFYSANNYPVASLGSGTSLTVGDRVYSAGFPNGTDPSRSGGFTFREGEVTLLPDRALEKGYQLGVTNRLDKGMSGGPLLNSRGEVVGINGMHAYPLWGDPYIYVDGSQPDPGTREVMVRSSWAIPTDTLVQLAANLPLQQPSTGERPSEGEQPFAPTANVPANLPENFPAHFPPVAWQETYPAPEPAPQGFHPQTGGNSGLMTDDGFSIQPLSEDGSNSVETIAPPTNNLEFPQSQNRGFTTSDPQTGVLSTGDGLLIQPLESDRENFSNFSPAPDMRSPGLVNSSEQFQPNLSDRQTAW
jgi:hypothetical protein